MKLIDADALKAVLMETKAESGNIGEVIAKIFCGVIDEQPEAVIRCKDCADWSKGCHVGDPDGLGCEPFCDFWESNADEDDFCSYGGRRTDETDRQETGD